MLSVGKVVVFNMFVAIFCKMYGSFSKKIGPMTTKKKNFFCDFPKQKNLIELNRLKL